MRAVLDTNVLVSGLLWKGAPHECLLAAESGLFTHLSAEAILDELQEKLIGKFDHTPEEAGEWIAGIRRSAELILITGKAGWVLADPDDDKFAEAAIHGAASAIVSGDRHLLTLGSIEGIPVLSPRQFLNRLAADRT